MKLAITLLSLAISANVFAYSLTDSTVLTLASPLLSTASTSGGAEKQVAKMVINDAQEYIQSGKASTFLSQKIKETQEMNDGASEEDALEVLISSAQTILE